MEIDNNYDLVYPFLIAHSDESAMLFRPKPPPCSEAKRHPCRSEATLVF